MGGLHGGGFNICKTTQGMGIRCTYIRHCTEKPQQRIWGRGLSLVGSIGSYLVTVLCSVENYDLIVTLKLLTRFCFSSLWGADKI